MQHTGLQFLTAEAGSDSARLAAKQTLALAVLRHYGRVRLRAKGSSMLPAIWPGDVLCIERAGADDTVDGDIVFFEQRGKLFAHRVIAARGQGERRVLVARGDSLPNTGCLVRSSQLLGRVNRVIRAGKEMEPDRHPGAASRVASWLLRRSGPLRGVALAWHSRRCRLAAAKEQGIQAPKPVSS